MGMGVHLPVRMATEEDHSTTPIQMPQFAESADRVAESVTAKT